MTSGCSDVKIICHAGLDPLPLVKNRRAGLDPILLADSRDSSSIVRQPVQNDKKPNKLNLAQPISLLDYAILLTMQTVSEKSSNQPASKSSSGVDLTLIRWMASKTPEERLRILQNNVASIIRLRNARDGS